MYENFAVTAFDGGLLLGELRVKTGAYTMLLSVIALGPATNALARRIGWKREE